MKSDANTQAGGKVLRRDAAENRQRLLDAAATVFSTRGIDAGVDEIARVAGVGIGTLYRRFPTKDALVSELVRQVFYDFVALANEASSAPNGEGLEQVLYGTGAILASNRGCLSRMWNDDETTNLRDEYRRILFELLARAKQHGRIREDATDADLDLIFWSVRGVVTTTRGVTDTGWRRIMAIMIAGLRPGADDLDADPMSAHHITEIMDRFRAQ
ncbi:MULTISPECIES: TetR/AcrR family transcriptional regulator [unclassified Rhodococcus (in: high G+C Gram-positive bacteria)]|uniref:TetR/AcrR family transcriptional regulator n=1 Tax=unclassified Rhodococcus (in: high G+C Gram-positive bacteria) TaxID=192944 RepID=UPI00163A3039|nr:MULTISPECIES: TetR/AcrR family transcriptional regulator [unclassified Rhodococcus (in: high G+C Gram-positive bacteria)]MBC2638116.1 TetR/AcrR family transcriptional regulator [Rhodococcus sp. 3A]MBC2897139.1 TetR/AcrR family transcriptional regulator [Rhodococcus sp. 4CII]